MITYSERNNIGLIMLNRPEKRNALHPEMIEAVKDKLNSIKNDDDIKVLIISGEGSSFCAGADLAYLNELKDFSVTDNERDSEELAQLFSDLYNFPKPVIAAVNGPAIAGGCGLASVCDFIIADSEKAKFGYSEAKIGFVPAIVSIFLIKKIGEGKAKQLFLSAEILDAHKAYEIGFADLLSGDVLNDSFTFAEKLTRNSLTSLKMIKKMISAVSNLTVEEGIKYSIELNTISRSSGDFKEGLNNFLNKK
ncbi:MAG: enoyl-CoA hydratase/isomerase family protein [Ignavibacteriaceae bacterium]